MLHYDLGDVYDCFEWSKHHGNSGIEKESNSFGGYQTNFVILNVMLRYISRNCKIQNKEGNIIIYTREYCVGIQNEKSKMREYVFIVTRFRINSGILLVWQKKTKKISGMYLESPGMGPVHSHIYYSQKKPYIMFAGN